MNVEIGAEAELFPEKEYINGIAVAVRVIPSVAGEMCSLAYKPCWPVSFSARTVQDCALISSTYFGQRNSVSGI
jgi:hypothetical protein